MASIIIALLIIAAAFGFDRLRRPATYATVIPTMTVPKPDGAHAKPPAPEVKQ